MPVGIRVLTALNNNLNDLFPDRVLAQSSLTATANNNNDNLEPWYSARAPLYKELEVKVRVIMEEMLNSENILFDVIQSRVKSLESFKEKISRKGYSHPNQVEDFLGSK